MSDTENEFTDETVTQRSTADRVYDDLKSKQTLVGMVAVAVVVGVWSGWFDVPDWARDVLIAAVFGLLIGWIGSGKVWEWIKQPVEYQRILEIDSAVEKYREWFVPPEWWDSRVNESDGSPYLYDSDTYGVRDLYVDNDEERILINRSIWKGEATDPELETHKSAVYETRGRLRTWARRGDIIYNRISSLVSNIESRYWKSMADKDIEKNAEFPKVVQSELDKEIGDIRQQLDPDELDELKRLIAEIERDHGEIDPSEWGIDTGDGSGAEGNDIDMFSEDYLSMYEQEYNNE